MIELVAFMIIPQKAAKKRFNWSKKTEKIIEKNVVFSVLILPKEAAGISVDREQFWNDIEAIEKSKNA